MLTNSDTNTKADGADQTTKPQKVACSSRMQNKKMSCSVQPQKKASSNKVNMLYLHWIQVSWQMGAGNTSKMKNFPPVSLNIF